MNALRSDFRTTFRALRRSAISLLAFDLVFKLVALAVLGPLTAWVFSLFISSTGHLAVSNDQILVFLLSPAGAGAVVAWVTTTLATMFIEQAGLTLIARGALSNEHVGAAAALLTTARRLPALAALGLRQAALYLLVSVPFIAAGALAYVLLLSRLDINYVLAAKPPTFWVAAAIAAACALGLGFSLARLYLRWVFAVPVCLLEQRLGAEALAGSRRLVAAAASRIAIPILVWVGAVALTSFVIAAVSDVAAEWVLSRFGGSVRFTIFLTAAVLAINGLTATALSFFGFTVFCSLITHLYLVRHEVDAEAPPHHEKQAVLVPVDPTAKRRFRKYACLIAAAIALSTGLLSGMIIENLEIQDSVAVTAHRGSSAVAPENSISAVKQAIEDQADFAEIDVQETADGVVVVMHDEDLMRIAGLDKKIWDINYEELRTLDTGSWFDAKFANERIPTLQEMIDIARGRIKLNIELKFNGHDQELAKRVIELVCRNDFESECIITSLNYDGLSEVRQINDQLRLGYIVFGKVGPLSDLEVEIFSVSSKLCGRGSLIRGLHRNDKEIHVWTVNSASQMTRFLDLGVDNIITDHPEVLVALLRERAALTDAERVLLVARNWLRQ